MGAPHRSRSPAFYLWLLKVAYDVISEAKVNQPKVASALNAVWILFLVSWTIYPVAYLMPVISETAGGVVARQVIYSFADIFSKAVYGVMLGYIAQKLSADEGYEPAIRTSFWERRQSRSPDLRSKERLEPLQRRSAKNSLRRFELCSAKTPAVISTRWLRRAS